MRVAKYKAATMREALAQAKRELGESAIILSTRELRRGVVGAGAQQAAQGAQLGAERGHDALDVGLGH